MNRVVSTDWLAAKIGSPDLFIVDVRDADSFAAGHIYGSVSIPAAMPACAWFWSANFPDPAGPWMELPTPDALFAVLGQAGIKASSTVVVVGTAPALPPPYDLADVTRVADTLMYAGVGNVAVLDGGYTKWAAEDRLVSVAPPQVQPVVYNGKVLSKTFVSTEYVYQHIGKSTIIDARDADVYSGEAIEPWCPKAGHLPTATSLPAALIWNADGTYRPSADLAALARQATGPSKGNEIIVYCGVGGYASSWWFVLTQVLGYQNVKFYDGSAQAWAVEHDMVY
jgi:thiosulfate/3-mercaptopyruvate sulfurtransferase